MELVCGGLNYRPSESWIPASVYDLLFSQANPHLLVPLTANSASGKNLERGIRDLYINSEVHNNYRLLSNGPESSKSSAISIPLSRKSYSLDPPSSLAATAVPITHPPTYPPYFKTRHPIGPYLSTSRNSYIHTPGSPTVRSTSRKLILLVYYPL